MKKVVLSMLLAMCSWLSLSASVQSSEVFERTYISTDRQIYLSGDRVWCSAFCFDLSTGELSGASAVAYVELVSNDNIAATAKISLFGGRGGGYLDIPASTPTGNYALVAFTAQNKNEAGYDFAKGARIISVYNAESRARVPGGVEIVPFVESPSLSLSQHGPVSMSLPLTVEARDTASIVLNCAEAATLSISVARQTGLPLPSSHGIEGARTKGAEGLSYVHNVLPEYDGEVLYATVEGPDRDEVMQRGYATGYLSTIGESNDTYTAQMAEDGSLVFRTYNIFGDKDVISQVDADDAVDAHIDIDSPFVRVSGLEISPMRLSESMKAAIEGLYPSVSSGEMLSRKEDVIFTDDAVHSYVLDDYTRFYTLKEVFVEIVTEVRSRGKGDKFRLEILTKDNAGESVTRWQQSLVLMDGVPVFQHHKLINFDATKIDRVDVWRKPYCVGDRVYKGVVNLVTKEGGVEYINFGSNVRIVSFKGVSYPMSCTARPDSETDNREVLYWHPLVNVEAGKSSTLDCLTPDRPGLYVVTLEGVTESGSIFRQQGVFRVE